MEPIKFWEFLSLILEGLGYERYLFLSCVTPFITSSSSNALLPNPEPRGKGCVGNYIYEVNYYDSGPLSAPLSIFQGHAFGKFLVTKNLIG